MKFPGYFLIVSDFIKWAKANGHAGGAGARLGRRLGRGLEPRHHRPRPLALRPPVRALPQPRARVDAGLRHRLLRGPARRGDRLCPRPLRRRPGGADHHLRHAAGARGPARRRPGAGPAVRPRRPDLQAGAAQPGQSGDAGAGDRARAAAEGGARRRSGRGADDRHRAAARGPAAQRLDPCRRRGDRRPAAGGAGAALPRSARADAVDPVQHEGRREGGPGQVRLPGPVDAHHAGAGRAAGERARHAR